MSTTPNMGLSLPTPTVTPGPQYATMNNQAFTVIDGHNHAPGSGVPIPSAGIGINADLPFNQYNATSLRSSRYVSQTSALSLPADLNCVYSVGPDLYYNDGNGNQIRLTIGGAVNTASAGNISGMGGTSAAVTYSNSSKTFTFTQASSTSALLDIGSITIRPTTAGAFGIQIVAPSSLSLNYSLTLPTSLPSGTQFMALSSSGQISAPYTVDNSTIDINGSNQIEVKNGGITNAKLASTNYALSSSSGSFSTTSGSYVTITNCSVSVTTVGRPVMVSLQPASTSVCYVSATYTSQGAQGAVQFLRDSSVICQLPYSMESLGDGSTCEITIPPASFAILDTGASAGSHTYTAQIRLTSGSNVTAYNVALLACEL